MIRESDFVQSVADALQFISYYHPADYIAHLGRAYAREQAPAARDAIAQILTNSRMCAEGRRPICQDTGIVNVFVKAGMGVGWDTTRSLQEMALAHHIPLIGAPPLPSSDGFQPRFAMHTNSRTQP